MKNLFKILFAITLAFVFYSCNKETIFIENNNNLAGRKLVSSAAYKQETKAHWVDETGTNATFTWDKTNLSNANMITAVFNNNGILNWYDEAPYSYVTVTPNKTNSNLATLESISDIGLDFTNGCKMYSISPVKKVNANKYVNNSGELSVNLQIPKRFTLTDSSKLSELKNYSYIYSQSKLIKISNDSIVSSSPSFVAIPSIFRFSITNTGNDDVYFQKIEMTAISNSGDTLKKFPSKLLFTASKDGHNIKEIDKSKDYSTITTISESQKAIKTDEKHLYYAFVLPADDINQFKDTKLRFKVYGKKIIDGSFYEYSYTIDKDITKLGEQNNDFRFKSGYIYTFNFDLKNMTEDYIGNFYRHGDYKVYLESKKEKPIKLIFLGDGYTKEDYVYGGKFDKHMNKSINALFEVEPYKTYKEYFTVYKIAFYSQDKGVTILNDMHYVNKKKCDTFFETVIEGGNVTLISCNTKKVYENCSKYLNLTKDDCYNSAFSLMINEDSVYAGTCMIEFGLNSKNEFCANRVAMTPVLKSGLYSVNYKHLLLHEFGGHGFPLLGDEYISYTDQTIPEDKVKNLESYHQWNYALNVSSKKEYDETPWKHFKNRPQYSHVSVYEGAFYYSYGVYRSEPNSCMIDNRRYFNSQSRYLIVKKILENSGEGFTMEKFINNDKIKFDNTATKQSPIMSTLPPLGEPIIKFKTQ